MKKNVLHLISIFLCFYTYAISAEKVNYNILVITADDMNWSSLGATGCPLKDISPNLDKFAEEAVYFTHSHIVSPICGPSRGGLHCGLFPHQSGSMGHGEQPPSWFNKKITTPTLSAYLHENGFFTGLFCKGAGRALDHNFDFQIDKAETDVGRNPEKYYYYTKKFIAESKAQKKAFFLNANMCDPHSPWAGEESEVWLEKEKKRAEKKGFETNIPEPPQKYKPEDLKVPDFLIDSKEVREEITSYYASVSRMDQCFGGIIKALKETGEYEKTMIIFFSDHGMGVTFGKRSNYFFGSKTPFFIKYPGMPEKTIGTKETGHVISIVDVFPTIVDFLELPSIKGLSGKSIMPLINGENIPWREAALVSFNCMNGENQYWPSRSLISDKFLYVFNGWVIAGHSPYYVLHGGGKSDDFNTKAFQKRWGENWETGMIEEFYKIDEDPGYWTNLIDNPKYQKEIEHFREMMKQIMKETGDQELHAFLKREPVHPSPVLEKKIRK